MDLKTVYFDEPGSENTEAVLRIARQRADELGIKKVVVASTSGDTAVKAMDVFRGLKVIAVSHVTGFRAPNTQEFTEENRRIVESKGGVVVTAAHAFAGLSRALRHKHDMYLLGEMVADTLRIFGEGMKVACEGADTAIVLASVNTHRLFDLKVKEILCKPHF